MFVLTLSFFSLLLLIILFLLSFVTLKEMKMVVAVTRKSSLLLFLGLTQRARNKKRH